MSIRSISEQLKKNGNELFKEKQYEHALSSYKEAIATDPSYKDPFLNAGMCYLQLNNFIDALRYFTLAIFCDKSYAKAYFQLGKAYCQMESLSVVEKHRILSAHKSFLADEQNQELDYSIEIYLLVADLKLVKDGTVKILEFGDGMKSAIRNNEIVKETLLKDFHAQTFLCNMPGMQEVDNRELEATLNGWQPHPAFDRKNFATYRGIYGGCSMKPVPKDIICLNGNVDTVGYLDEKTYMHELFARNEELVSYRPISKLFPLTYSHLLVEEIIRDIPGDVFVIKNSDGNQGKGVMLVKKTELDSMLKILTYEVGDAMENFAEVVKLIVEFQSRHKCKVDVIDIYNWVATRRKLFLVEELVKGKRVPFENNSFDPTMRVVFFMHNIDSIETPKIIPIDAYWKFPVSPVSRTFERGSIVSSFVNGANPRRGDVSSEDMHLVFEQLKVFMPILLETALQFKLNPDFQSLSCVSTDIRKWKQQQFDCMQLLSVNSSAHAGLYDKALFEVFEYLNRHPNSMYGKYEAG